MLRRRNTSNAAPLFVAVALSYAANCALGTAVAAKLIDTSGFRWLHHALYIATCAFGAAAFSAVWWGSPRGAGRRSALALVPAAMPLAAIPYVQTRSRRHPLVALAAAPFIAAGLICSLRPADRK